MLNSPHIFWSIPFAYRRIIIPKGYIQHMMQSMVSRPAELPHQSLAKPSAIFLFQCANSDGFVSGINSINFDTLVWWWRKCEYFLAAQAIRFLLKYLTTGYMADGV